VFTKARGVIEDTGFIALNKSKKINKNEIFFGNTPKSTAQ
jgi:hypothetical protein